VLALGAYADKEDSMWENRYSSLSQESNSDIKRTGTSTRWIQYWICLI